MIRLVRSFGPWTETAIVILLAFGSAAFGSVRSLFVAHSTVVFSDGTLLRTIIYEIVALGLITGFLWLRGWRLPDFGVTRITLRSTLIGFGLYVADIAAYYIAASLAPSAFSAASRPALMADDLHLPFIVLGSIINPIYEEAILCGYLISARRTGANPWPAVHLSILVRVLCHLYQGAFGVISLISGGFIFGTWYARSRDIWPLVLAHALVDVVGLTAFMLS